ncbi:MAG: D-lyxose/D-mannose family sugar isomerase [Clostridia bacterium]|nr:D-lyxose/D-mannose family sugar isomerase [Clostridia bacterium]
MIETTKRGCIYYEKIANSLADSLKDKGIDAELIPANELCLKPGDSVTLTPGLYHKFWGEEGKGTIIVQEVSMCNDDAKDNRFYEKTGRFPEIEEDEEPLYLLCNEYSK